MTVSSQTNNATFVGNGVTTVFPLPFRFFSNGDVFAYFIDPTTGASTPMVLGVDYTLTGAGEPEVNGNSVSVLTTTAPLANGRGLYVERMMQPVQNTDIVNQGEFFASTHEDVFDRLTMLIQQANGNSQGAIRVAIGDPDPARLVPAAARANLLMGFDSAGDPITVAPVSGSASDLAMSLANTSDPAKGVAIVGRAGQVVSSIIELRSLLKTSPSKNAFVTGYSEAGDGGVGAYYLDEADVSSQDDNWSVIVANDGARWKRLSSTTQNFTTSTDVSTVRLARNTSHTGGTPGFVNSALRIDTSVGAAVDDFEWGLTSTLANSAAAGENVAIYGQAKKLSTGPTWAMVAEARDEFSTGNPTSGLVGIEVDVFSNGIDDYGNRVGIDIVVGRHNPVGTACECGIGIRLNPQGRSLANGYFDVGIKFDGLYNVCLDMTGVIGGDALVMVMDQAISLEATKQVKLSYSSSTDRIVFAGNKRLHATGGLSFPSAGLISTTATAGIYTLPSNPAGFISILLDGAKFKLPYYGD